MYDFGTETFAPGQCCPRSGRYTVRHYQHRLWHSAVVFAGEEFPRCHRCGDRVRYVLEEAIAGLAEDPDFSSTSRKKAA
jgi:hypothetical protein